MIAEVFAQYVYNIYGINYFLDVDDCMCYDLWHERCFYVADGNQHKNYNILNVYLEND